MSEPQKISDIINKGITPEKRAVIDKMSEEAQKKQDEKDRADFRARKKLADIPFIFEDATFLTWKTDSRERMGVLTKARRYVAYTVNSPRPVGLTLQGKTGTGKSRLAATIANELLAKKEPVRFLLSADIGEEDFNDLVKVKYLIIDDLGLADGDYRIRTKITRLISKRYYANLATIITTNNTGEELAKIIHKAIIFRLGASSVKIDFDGIVNERINEVDELEKDFNSFEEVNHGN